MGHGFESFLSVANIPQDPHDVELSGNRQSKLFDGEEDYGVFVYVCMCVHVGGREECLCLSECGCGHEFMHDCLSSCTVYSVFYGWECM